MSFAFGYIAGLATSILIITTLTYFRRVVERKITVMEKLIENAGPRPKGFIVEPLSDADNARAQIIARNKSQGRDTPINELL